MSHPPKRLKKSLITVFLSGILAVLGHFIVLNGISDLYQHIADNSSQKKAEGNLHAIYTGASVRYTGSIFDPPAEGEHPEDGGVHEHIYPFKKFHLQMVCGSNNAVILYPIASEDGNLHPEVPRPRKTLGYRFKDFGSDTDYLQSSYSSKPYQYEEGHYLGNPGNYRNFYLAYNPAEVDYFELDPLPDFPSDDKPSSNKNDLEEFRNNNAPDIFGIDDIHGGPERPELGFGLGIDYYDARDIPDRDQ